MPIDGTDGSAALDRLGALHIPAYVVDDQVHGRLRVDASRLGHVPDLTIERNHTFVMDGANALSFMAPSPLSLLGPVSIEGAASERDVVARVQARWTKRLEGLIEALQKARAVVPEARWAPETLWLEAHVVQDGITLQLRFSEDGASVWVVGLSGILLEGATAADVAALAVSTAASKAMVRDALIRAALRAKEFTANVRGGWESMPPRAGAPPPRPTVPSVPPGYRPPPTMPPMAEPPGPRRSPPPPVPPPSMPPPTTPGVSVASRAGGSLTPKPGGPSLPPATTPGILHAVPLSSAGIRAIPLSAMRMTGDVARAVAAFHESRPTDDVARLAAEASRVTADVPRGRSTGDLGRATGDVPRTASGLLAELPRATGDVPRTASGLFGELPRATGDVPRTASGLSRVTGDFPRGRPTGDLARVTGDVPPRTGDFGRPPPTTPGEVIRSSDRVKSTKMSQLPHAPLGSMASPPPSVPSTGAPRKAPSFSADIPIEEPVLYTQPSEDAVVAGSSPRLGAFDDPFQAPQPEIPVDSSYVVRKRRIDVDVAAVLHVGARSLPARVYNLSAGGAFVAIDLAELPQVGALVELGATGYQPVKARVMRVRPRDPLAQLPAGLGLQLIPDPSLRRPATMTHVLIASPDTYARRKMAAAVAKNGMLPVPASDVVAAYVASQTLPLSVMVIDPLIAGMGDWRELPEGIGATQRGTQVVVIQDSNRPHRGLPPGMIAATIDDLANAVELAINRGRN